MVQVLKTLIVGALALVAIPALAQEPSCSITANPQTVIGSSDVVLNWTTQNAVQCVASGNWSGPKACGSGSQTMVSVNSDRTYNLTVRSATGGVTVTWNRPLTNTDGTPTTIGGYKLYVAPDVASVPGATPIDLPASPLTHSMSLAPGTYSFGMRAVRASDNVESAMSNIVTRTVATASARCSVNVTVTTRPKAPFISVGPGSG